MIKKHVSTQTLLAIAMLGLSAGCLSTEGVEEKIIADMIRNGLAEKGEIMSSNIGGYSDYKVYHRDGEQDGEVFEYIFAQTGNVEESKRNAERRIGFGRRSETGIGFGDLCKK